MNQQWKVQTLKPRGFVTPLKSEYYGKYRCEAENPLGRAFHEIELEEAHEPSKIQQAIIDKTTATTLQFRFVQPTDMGGLQPIHQVKM